MRRGVLAAAAVIAMGAAAPSEAAVRALLVGVDDYQGPPKLMGSVNDVRDLAAVLTTGGVPVETLEDAGATRGAVIERFRAMIAASGPGDLLYVHFSGHGISIPDADGDEADGRDESYLLRDFDEVTKPDEQLVDDDLDALFQEASAAGRAVLFVADACHSGSPAREVGEGALPTRLYRPKAVPTRPAPVAPHRVDADRSAITVAGATLDDRTIPEIMIDGRPRGALSFATARALEGHADLDGDGRVTAREFEVFVRQTVRNVAAAKQTPQFVVPDGARTLLAFAAARTGAGSAATGSGLAPDALPVVAVHVLPGEGAEAVQALVAKLPGVILADSPSAAELLIDPAKGTALNAVRDVVASGEAAAEDVPRIVETHRVLDGINRLALGGTLRVDFSPDDAVQPEGAEIAFDVAGLKHPYLTVFDVTATGTIHRLWPLGKEDTDPWPLDRPFQIAANVTPPFGADTLVVVATPQPPEALRAALAGTDGGAGPATLYAALAETTRKMPYQIGIQAFFTAEETPK